MKNRLLHDFRLSQMQSCQFGGDEIECSDAFKLVYTDFGGCFVFNADKEVQDIGSEVGLRVTINLEQYEYMPGKNKLHEHKFDKCRI